MATCYYENKTIFSNLWGTFIWGTDKWGQLILYADTIYRKELFQRIFTKEDIERNFEKKELTHSFIFNVE